VVVVATLEEFEHFVCMSMWPSCTKIIFAKKNLAKSKLLELKSKWTNAKIIKL
jgi:hypothetical protein